MASPITLALDSDPGLLLGISQRLDGVEILKYGNAQINHELKITSCTKGDWQSRASAFKDIFGTVPIAITDNIGELEQIRHLRNKVGHAFGRDIEEARKYGVKDILPMESLKLHVTIKYGKLLWSVAKAIDVQLLEHHVGEYQALQFYHRLLPSFPKNMPASQRPFAFKKQIGRFKAQLPGKLLCKQLVKYYDEL